MLFWFQICADELGSIVEGHDVKKLKMHGGADGIANKLSMLTATKSVIRQLHLLVHPRALGERH